MQLFIFFDLKYIFSSQLCNRKTNNMDDVIGELHIMKVYPETIVDGPGFRYSIYLSGCRHHCPGCQNPNSWNPLAGLPLKRSMVDEIVEAINENPLLDGVTFSGGDPFFNPKDFGYILKRVKKETGKNILKSTGFELIAFPKKVSNQKAYFPRFSYINEEPLWKLNDMLNQTQLPSFKEGKIQEDKVIVAAIPGSNMKNYNLFLAMPAEKVATAPFSLSNLFMIGLAISLILIVTLSTILINSITSPVKILTENAIAIQQDSAMQKNQITFSDSNELESISTGLTNLVVKVKEFQENKNSCENLFKSNPMNNDCYELSSFISQENYDNKSLCYISRLNDNLAYMFLARVDNADNLTASLPLTMYAMAIKLFIEQLNMRSPIGCIRNLEEYFRINLRRNLDGSGLIVFIDTNANKIEYAGFGKIKVLKTNYSEKKCDILSLPQGANFIKEVKEQGNATWDLSEGDSLVAITEPLSEIKIETLRQMLESNSDFSENFSNTLETNLKNLAKLESSSCSVAFVHRKELTEAQILKKKLAENNPIALIRSQKAGSQTNV